MLKKVLGIFVLALLAWFLVTQPADAADAVQGAWDAIVQAFESIITFFTSLFD